ncbi:UvrD-helicase domain-containing protein [Undibacterium sp. TC4M20W]|uniref:UvrD-helicase domain-containing protein n=1 Tax=Undibacterium sp. TC4M20W TaxID=3413052 RepID=UPI003BF013C9
MNEYEPTQFIPKLLIPNEEQIDIQLAKHKVIIAEANAGAAKTTTLAFRVGQAITNNITPESILALVFTSTARDVMQQRLIDIGIHFSVVKRIEIATFEEFSVSELAKVEDSEKIESCMLPRQQKKHVLAAMEQVYERYGHLMEFQGLAQTSRAINQFLDIQLKLKAKKNLDLDADFEIDELDTVYERLNVNPTEYLVAREYERIRLGYNDHPVFRGPFDATYDLARRLTADPQTAQNFRDYRTVVCDELHDLNEAAFSILCALIKKPRCFFVGAGDKDQVIHSTLGANREFLTTRFKQEFPFLQQYPLTITYRHGPHLAYPMQNFTGKDFESYVANETEIKVAHYDGTAEGCAACVVDAITKWKRDRNPIDGCAILMRGWHQSIAIENALKEAEIPYKTPEMASYLQREEILFLRGIMAIALKDLGSVKSYPVRCGIIDALILFGEIQIDAKEIESVKYQIAKNPDVLIFFFDRYVAPSNSNDPTGLLNQAVKYMQSVSPGTKVDVIIRNISKHLNLEAMAAKIYVRPYEASVVTKSISGFLSVAVKADQTLQEFWLTVNFSEAFATKKREKGFVVLDCVSNAKGKEFPHVILPFLETDEFPNVMFDLEEERNLFYVGATRTISRLTLITPNDPGRRSQFIKKMKIPETVSRANLAVQRNENIQRTPRTNRRYLKTKFEEGKLVKSMGAKFDWARKAWYIENDSDPKPFEQWL